MQITNIAGYKFIPLDELPSLRSSLLEECTALQCKGTILLAAEGININLAGEPASIEAFKAYLYRDSRFTDVRFRESFSTALPFQRLKVKLKTEIITMEKPAVRPEITRAPHISPHDLKQWLDEKRDMTLLDTRNAYEVRFGTFAGAEHLGLQDFGEFPEEASTLSPERPVVMFCTGGIRCEKAALELLQNGFPEVYQLEGGILNYFAAVGGEHYQGECFVFDERVSVAADLKETGTVQCLTCQGPVTQAMQTCTICDEKF